jgi:hypothetical protein
MLNYLLLAAALGFILAAYGCGGGGSSSSDNGNTTAATAVAAVTPTGPVDSGTSVTLDGSGSSDSDGTISTYVWSQVSPGSPAVDFSGDDTSTSDFVFIAPTVTAQTVFSFQLIVTDNDGNTSTADVTLTVNASTAANTAPTADAAVTPAGPVDEGTSVTLDGSGSSDSDGTISTYVWSQVSPASPAVDFSGDDTSDAEFTFTAPAIDTQTTFTFRLTVTDDDSDTGTSDVQLTVDPTNAISIFQQIRDNVSDLTADTPSTGDDWFHWGGVSGSSTVTRIDKAAGTDLTSDYAAIGTNDGVRPIVTAHRHAIEWSDGDGTTNVGDLAANFNSGIFFSYNSTDDSQQGNGFEFTVPATSTPRTLTLIVGAQDAEMKITANLNSSSAPATPILSSSDLFIDNPVTTNLSTSSYNAGMFRKVTIIYRGGVASADQLTVQCTLNEDNASASALFLEAAILSEGAATAPAITPNGGHFTGPVEVQNMTAYPDDAEIRYTTDGSDPTSASPLFSSITLSSTTTVKAQAFRAGYADSPVTTAVFTIGANTGGSLSATVAEAPTEAVDLTAIAAGASEDWTQYGKDDQDDVNRKTTVSLIGSLTEVDPNSNTTGPLQTGAAIPYAFDWSDGSSTTPSEATGTNIRRGVFYTSASGVGGGYSITVPIADTNPRTLYLYMGVQDAEAKVSASLSSGSADPVEVTITNAPATNDNNSLLFKVVEIDFTAATASDTLTVTCTMEDDFSTASAVSIQSAIVVEN